MYSEEIEDIDFSYEGEEFTGCINDDVPHIERINIYDGSSEECNPGIRITSYDDDCSVVNHSYDLGSLRMYIQELQEYELILSSELSD